MGGGLIQLVATGVQDIHLTGNPEITLFKTVYRRHTNFALESIQQTTDGKAGYENKITSVIKRKGDLLGKTYAQIKVTDNSATGSDDSLFEVLQNNGYAFIDYVEYTIGGQTIERHTGDWLNIWSELSTPYDKMKLLQRTVNPQIYSAASGTPPTSQSTSRKTRTLYLPLYFSFCKDWGRSLPLIALQYHEVKINIVFNKYCNVLSTTSVDTACSQDCLNYTIESCELYSDYIFLDTDERKRFATMEHEYLIEQVQISDNSILSTQLAVNIELEFNHPVKELIWVIEATKDCPATEIFNYWNNGVEAYNIKTSKTNSDAPHSFYNKDHLKTAVLQLNGHERMERRKAGYFRNVQRFQHHTGCSSLNYFGIDIVQTKYDIDAENHSAIYLYSFALEPEKLQPTGTCNFSRIDNAVLSLELEPHYQDVNNDTTNLANTGRDIRIYAVNYNVLRIMHGMGGLAYSN